MKWISKFRKLWKKKPDPDRMRIETEGTPLPDNPSLKCQLVYGLLRSIGKDPQEAAMIGLVAVAFLFKHGSDHSDEAKLKDMKDCCPEAFALLSEWMPDEFEVERVDVTKGDHDTVH